MKKYLLKRIIFSIFSLIIVVGVVMVLIYSAIDRSTIFAYDLSIVKYANNEEVAYKYNKLEKYGYLDYETYASHISTKYKLEFGDEYDKSNEFKSSKDILKKTDIINAYLEDGTKSDIQGMDDVVEFVTLYAKKGYKIEFYTEIKGTRTQKYSAPILCAVKDHSLLKRVWKYFSNLITFESIHDVAESEDIPRYIRFEWDEISNMPALVGSGTRHKYLIYFDDKFPYIHQNIVHLNLGTSYVTYKDQEITDVMTSGTGSIKLTSQEYPAQIGTGNYVETAYDFHTVTYNVNVSDLEKSQFKDNYTLASQTKTGISRIGNSFIIGLIATFLSYLLGLPIGIWMSRKKDKAVDKIGMGYIIFIMAVPSLAYIFIFAAIGYSVFHLPYKFAIVEGGSTLVYILPIVSLALPSVASLMKWMRRYMIDQMNSDYVKFARSQGLSESEIFNKHIFKNALIYLVHGIPGAILGCLTGAIITERVYSVPGIGNLLTEAINKYDNGVIVGATVFYTTLSIISLILGDILLAKYDPRISFTDGGK